MNSLNPGVMKIRAERGSASRPAPEKRKKKEKTIGKQGNSKSNQGADT